MLVNSKEVCIMYIAVWQYGSLPGLLTPVQLLWFSSHQNMFFGFPFIDLIL